MSRATQRTKSIAFSLKLSKKYARVIDIMIAQPNILALMKFNSLNYEKLIGDKAGISSVRVNDQYRIEFEERCEGTETIATICNITDLTNHYK